MTTRSGNIHRPKRVTLRDIAAAAHVSIPVAGLILNGGAGNNSRASEATTQRVRRVAQRMGYRPNLAARHLRGKRTFTYGLLVASAGDPQRALLVQQLDIEAVRLGCHTLIGNTIATNLANQSLDQFDYHVDEFVRRGVDGVLCAVHAWSQSDRRRLLQQHPNTVFYEDPGIPGSAWIAPDYPAASRISVEHLVKRGCRRIGLAILDLPWDTYAQRVEGYREAIRAAGLTGTTPDIHYCAWRRLAPELVGGIVASFDYLWVMANQIVDDLVLRQKADGIMTYDDYLGAALVTTLRHRGIKCPDEVAVVGFSDHILSPWADPSLTTVDLNYGHSAELMVPMLERIITEGWPSMDDRSARTEPTLVVRGSA